MLLLSSPSKLYKGESKIQISFQPIRIFALTSLGGTSDNNIMAQLMRHFTLRLFMFVLQGLGYLPA